MPWMAVARIEEVPLGGGMAVAVGGVPVALFRTEDGRVFAIEDSCPHMGMPLHNGRLDGTVVRCVHHGLRIDVATGATPGQAGWGCARFETKCADGQILLWVEAGG